MSSCNCSGDLDPVSPLFELWQSLGSLSPAVLLWHWGNVSFQGYRFGRRKREVLHPDESITLTKLWFFLGLYLYFMSNLPKSRSLVSLLPTDIEINVKSFFLIAGNKCFRRFFSLNYIIYSYPNQNSFKLFLLSHIFCLLPS